MPTPPAQEAVTVSVFVQVSDRRPRRPRSPEPRAECTLETSSAYRRRPVVPRTVRPGERTARGAAPRGAGELLRAAAGIRTSSTCAYQRARSGRGCSRDGGRGRRLPGLLRPGELVIGRHRVRRACSANPTTVPVIAGRSGARCASCRTRVPHVCRSDWASVDGLTAYTEAEATGSPDTSAARSAYAGGLAGRAQATDWPPSTGDRLAAPRNGPCWWGSERECNASTRSAAGIPRSCDRPVTHHTDIFQTGCCLWEPHRQHPIPLSLS